MTAGSRPSGTTARSGRRQRTGTGRIDHVDLARYLGPGRPLTRPRGLVVSLRLSLGTDTITGVGEAVVPATQAELAWRQLKKITSDLIGAAWPDQPTPVGTLRELAGWRPARAVDRGAVRAAKLAVEMALLDLVAKTGADWGDASGAGRLPAWLPVQQLPRVAPSGPTDAASAALSGPKSAWALKLKSSGDPKLDLAWLAHLARHPGRADRPLWLVSGGLEPSAARDFVRALAELMAAGEIAGEVLLEEPLPPYRSTFTKLRERSALARWRRPPLAELQCLADEVLGGGPRLSIMASNSVVSASQVRQLCGPAGVRALHLSPGSFGSLLGLRDAALAAKRADPAVLVLLGGVRGSAITAGTLAALAAGTDEIDRYTPEPPVGEWPTLAGGPEQARLFAGIDLAELSAVADEIVAADPMPVPAGTAGDGTTGAGLNRFPEYPLPGVGMPLRSALLETEALRSGLRTCRFSKDLLLTADLAGHTIGFSDSESSPTSFAASVVALRKGATRDMLAAQGLPVAEGATFPAAELERAYDAGLAFGFPLVVKPAGGSMGTAVTIGITSGDELRRALNDVAASRYAETGVVVERFATGADYRIFATSAEVLSVVRREPASVVGDGYHTVEELVLFANMARRHNPHLGKRLIKIDSRVDEQLRRQRMTRRSIPAAGQRVRLRAEANFSQGGESHEVLDETHPTVLRLAVATVAAIPGLPHAGLDILLADHRRPVDEQDVTIIEVNSRPVQTIHHFPLYGPPRNVSEYLVRTTAQAAGCQLRAGPDELTIQLVVRGHIPPAEYRRWFVRMAEQFGITGWIFRSRQAEEVRAVLQGPAFRVGLMVPLAFQGPSEAEVVETLAEPVAPVSARGFTVRAHDRSAPPATGRPVDAGDRFGGTSGECRAVRSGPASELLAAVARQRGLSVNRFDADLVTVSGGGRQVLFCGLAGAAVGKVAQVLCGDAGWLRRWLADRGVPVRGRSDAAGRAEVAVVGDQVVACRPADAPPVVGELALRALAAVPGAGYGSVRLVFDPSGVDQPSVDQIDPTLGWWVDQDEETAAAVVEAILDHELDSG